jgi:peptide/nickel transport system substrate-binding protein
MEHHDGGGGGVHGPAPDGLSRRAVMGRLAVGGLALGTPGFLTACAGSRSGGNDRVDTTIASAKWPLGSTVSSLDIANSFDLVSITVQSLALEGLLKSGNDLSLQPGLAISHQQPDPLTWVFRLRDGVRFWDGSPLTPDDVVYSLNRHVGEKSTSILAGYFGKVKSVKASGPGEVTITLSEPDPFLPYILVFSHIHSKAFAAPLGDQLGVAGPKVNVMGTGPFRVTSFASPSNLTVERHPGYWGPKPAVAKGVLNEITDTQTRRLAMQSGEIDGAFGVPLADTKAWSRIRGAKIQSAPGMQVAYIAMNVTRPPFNDIHVRRAIAYALDKQGYIKAFLGGQGEPATTMVSPQQWSGVMDPKTARDRYATLPQYPFDINRAKQELAQSAHASGFTQTVEFADSNPELGKVLVSLGETLKPLGITLNVKEVPKQQWLTHKRADVPPGMQIGFYSPDYADPANHLEVFYPSGATNNSTTYSSKAFEAALAKQRVAGGKARVEPLMEALKIAMTDLPYLPVYWGNQVMAVKDGLAYDGFNGLFYFQPWLGNLRRG